MIALPNFIGSLSLKAIRKRKLLFILLGVEREEPKIWCEFLDDVVNHIIAWYRPAIAMTNALYFSMNDGNWWGGNSQVKPFDHLFQFIISSSPAPLILPSARRQSSKAISFIGSDPATDCPYGDASRFRYLLMSDVLKYAWSNYLIAG